jgi:EAL domain-containing protein (putative c-di-GMP-specific phosphodiesterase class I)
MTQDNIINEESYSLDEFLISIENDQLQLLYQPIVSLKNNKIYFAEASIFLQHPTLGDLHADRLFSIAKKNNYLYKLDSVILERACAQIVLWKKKLPDLENITIRLSGETSSLNYIAENITSTLYDAKCKGEWINIQLSENIVMNASKMDLYNIDKLKKHGILFTIENFAAGNISFIKLESFPSLTIKVNYNSLNNFIHSNKKTLRRLFCSIETISHDFNHKLIINGIDSKEKEKMFKDYKYDFAQGEHYSNPVLDVNFVQLFDRLPLCRLVK